MLGTWPAEPYVARWWNHPASPEAVARSFGRSMRGEEPSEDLLMMLAGRAFGLVQRSRYADYPEELAHVPAVPAGAMSVDYLIGEPDLVGRELGPRMIGEVVASTWAEFPEATCVLVPVHAGNRASWRALEKAGFVRVAEGELEPANPIDDRRHRVYRIDRPAQ
ncbi:hypothetical protein GCM10022252_62310 [Streptosporangium oxazolinicum]|uniref:GNAT family N-acetyltransferase n=1 Tax=Streptosporangium oxazolinicum TaxID=909287 RepID=A0ABP8BEI2_9ACTN